MLTLSLDLAGEIGSATISSDVGPLATVELHLQRAPLRHCARLIDAAARLADVPVKQIDRLCTIIGPGSWTGLRVAATTVNTLSITLHIPVIPITMFEVFQTYLAPNESNTLGIVQIGHNRACVATLDTSSSYRFYELPKVSILRISSLANVLEGRKAILAVSSPTLKALRDQCGEATLVDTRHLPRPAIVAADIAAQKWQADPSHWTTPVRPFYVGSPLTVPSTHRRGET
jgi:tRNA threonylcarbamoyl adenosine modification protein YeaZ